MGIGNAINACAHLNNVANARLGLTSLPATKVNLALALALHRAGFISSVHRGGPQPPTPQELAAPPAPRDARQRRDAPPLARHEPKRPIHIKAIDLHRVVRGFASKDGLVKGLQLGECIFLMTDQGMMEGREALSRNMGGIVLCRAR
ncbi:mitochondrial 37S ribosomal protein MRPS8 [Verticillium alfalfae VaMs.102]|uniref:Mitochondrial 37S ribosomal protein S8 n=1 Tax=Verticillium alfalfae (strain VaMs.102 / ATCC MYA-4576 / FGSC 10136) TaxID=526221 RepID=C9SEZ2_VERA1|nr:mitochondrial 37S ribosomal protein MRPS8 [Verticillium alfalfae VaMs.102]EEY17778.1 mitochondrial 37S ribosomal protein S8 [Verticillium alfalfae VaMs.102]